MYIILFTNSDINKNIKIKNEGIVKLSTVATVTTGFVVLANLAQQAQSTPIIATSIALAAMTYSALAAKTPGGAEISVSGNGFVPDPRYTTAKQKAYDMAYFIYESACKGFNEMQNRHINTDIPVYQRDCLAGDDNKLITPEKCETAKLNFIESRDRAVELHGECTGLVNGKPKDGSAKVLHDIALSDMNAEAKGSDKDASVEYNRKLQDLGKK